jgi:hypothetical protein
VQALGEIGEAFDAEALDGRRRLTQERDLLVQGHQGDQVIQLQSHRSFTRSTAPSFGNISPSEGDLAETPGCALAGVPLNCVACPWQEET